MELVVREVVHQGPDYEALVDLRQRVLRVPFGYPLTQEELDGESGQIHLGAFLGGRLVGCLLLKKVGEEMRMRQVAVEFGLQGQGIGSKLVSESEAVARGAGASELRLHARANAVPFYEALGYRPEGELFEEIGIPHLLMSKRLD